MTKYSVTVDAMLEPIMGRYLEIRLEEIGLMEQAVASGDTEQVRLLGHRLKGTGASYGFPNMTELGAAIEGAAKGEDLAMAGGLIAAVRDFFENVEIVYGELG